MNKRGFGFGILIFVIIIIFGAVLAFYFLASSDNEDSGEINQTANQSVCGNNVCEADETPESCSADCTMQVNETHTICSNNTCTTIEGAGENECGADTDCEVDEGLPDLIISNISMEVTDEDTNETTNITLYAVTVHVTIKNIGKAKANSTVTSVSFGSESSAVSSGNMFTQALEPDQEVTIESAYEDLDEGKYFSTAFADNLLKIEEENEDNNGFRVIKLNVRKSSD